jgi:SAM-dependent methyltransferase
LHIYSLKNDLKSKIVSHLRAKGWLGYPKTSPSLEAYNRALNWIAMHSENGNGIARDSNSQTGDRAATLRMLWSLEIWGESHKAKQFKDWLALYQSVGNQSTHLARASSEPRTSSNYTTAEAARLSLDAGNRKQAAAIMDTLVEVQSKTGGIPLSGRSGNECPLSTILAANLWFRLGDWTHGECAYQAFMKASKHGRRFPAFVFDPPGITDFSETITAFLEALHYRLRLNFERTASQFPAHIAEDDGRYKLIESLIELNLSQVVADVGCGKGRFIKLLKERNPSIQAWGIDISTAMLRLLPPEISTCEGSLISTGLPSRIADYVFCIEALEHAVNARAAVRELSRITKDEGVLVIIDKCADHIGTMQLCDWEQWFNEREVTVWLQEEGFQVEVRRGILKPGADVTDKRFLSWIARR